MHMSVKLNGSDTMFSMCTRLCCSDGLATGIWSTSVLSNYISISQGGDDAANTVRSYRSLGGRSDHTWRPVDVLACTVLLAASG